jgi:hypothetical protein
MNREGRMVAAALISRTPVSRDDACMYTNDAVVIKEDPRLIEELKRDYNSTISSRRLLPPPNAPSDSTNITRTESTADTQDAVPNSNGAVGGMAYGYPGALPADVSILDKDAATRVSERLARPSSMRELEDSLATKNLRRSANTSRRKH